MIINDKPKHYTGLSTDTKPNLGYSGNGYVFLESDSGLEYVYSAKIGTWLPLSEPGDAPCVGVLKIEKTSSEGLIDTYTIRYTNGSSTTFNVTNGCYITPNIDESAPIISDKVYSLGINADKYELYKVVRLNSVYSADPDIIKSDTIDYTKFWPRLDEGKFILARTADNELVFNYVGTYDGVETWQAIEVASVDTIIRYIGHFKYIDNNNQNNLNYYFVATRQILSIDGIESRLNDEITRSEAADNELAEDLANEITRAENAEETLQDNIDTEKQARIDAINALDLAQVGSTGNYIKYVSQEDGQVAAQKQAFDTDFTSPSNNNAPTTQAVKNLIDSLDASQVGQNGYYIKTISEENGIVTATKEAFETSIPNLNPSEVLAPTVKAVKDYVDSETTRAIAKETEITNSIGQYGDASATQTVYGYLKAEEERAIAKETEINAKIPAQASASNQLADKAYVEDAVSTATAIFRGNFNLVSDLELNVDASHATISTVLEMHIAIVDNNDYCYVTIPTDVEHPLLIKQIDRYKHNNTNWEYEYTLNNSGYTTAQWNAINSGITTNLVTDLNTNTSKRHEHANKNLLDSYNQSNADLTDAVNKKHNHRNQGLLDTYTQTEADLAAAVDNTHIHNNKQILDATTASFTTALETYLTNTPLAVDYDTTNHLLYKTTAAGNTTTIVGLSTLVHDAGLDDAEHTANRVSAFQNTPDNTHYPTEKLVKDSLDSLELNLTTMIEETVGEIEIEDFEDNGDIYEAFQEALNPSSEE